MQKNRLLIISGYIDETPPTGGVTMHVHRLIKQVIAPLSSQYMLCDYKKEGILEQIRKIKNADVMHMHASNAYLKLFYVVMGKILRTKSIITVHGKYGVYSPIKNFVHRISLNLCDCPILINQESYEAVRSFNKQARYIPAFIPPIVEEETLPADISNRIAKIREDAKKLFITNASSRAFTDDGREIYGINFLISFFSKHSDYDLLILDPQGQYISIYEEQIPPNITIIVGKYSFCGAVRMSDFVVRNTPTDGDSFSVKEALCYHKKTLATDSVSRPKGVFLFKYNDENSFKAAIDNAIHFKEDVDLKGENAIGDYVQLYKKFGIINA